MLRDRAGRAPEDKDPNRQEPDAAHQLAAEQLDPVAVMASSMQRDGSALSALETLRKELSDADHLGVLGSIWHDLARREQSERFERSLRDCLPAALASQAMADPAHVWLWRSLRESEAAGLDGRDVLKEAVTYRSLAGANDPARVIDARVRWRIKFAVRQAQEPWSQRVPQLADPKLSHFMTELAAAMDARRQRIGQHAAQTTPLWATQALGKLPDDPAKRADWQQRAGVLGAYREMFGYDHPGDAIGPEPAKTTPEARAAWHTAFAALSHTGGIDLRGLTDEQLKLRRATYERETAWAPKYVADELRLARKQEKLARDEAARSAYQATAAEQKGDLELAAVHTQLTRSWRAAQAKSRLVREALTPAHDTRRQWEVMTEPTRRLAQAADLELKRRGLLPTSQPLTSAEPEGFIYPDPPAPPRRQIWIQPTLGGSAHLPEPADTGEPVSETQRDHLGLRMLGLHPAHLQAELPVQVTQIAAYNRQRREQIDDRRSIRVPSDNPDERDLGFAWAALADRDRDAILQPPKPQIRPAAEVLRRAAPEIAAHAREAEHG